MEKSGVGGLDEGWCSCGRKLDLFEVLVSPTTGGQFHLRVAASDSIEYLRRLVSKRLRVPKDRICLLYRDRHLRAGSLEENYIMEGARITLLPSVETGLLSQRPEQSVMQALESLNDAQVNDFLTGKAPLNLTMRLGDHMMLIQLQLSTVSPTGGGKKSSSRHSSSGHHHHHHHHHHYHHYHHHHPSHASNPCGNDGQSSATSRSPSTSSSHLSQSLHHHHHYHHSPLAHAFPTTPPHHISQPSKNTSPSSSSSPNTSPTASPSCLSFDSDLPIRGCPHQTGDTDPKASLDTKALAEASRNLTQTLKQLSSEVLTTKPTDKESNKSSSSTKRKASESVSSSATSSSSSSSSSSTSTSSSSASSSSGSASSGSSKTGSSSSSRRQGAIIESMQHHGKGVYSGTFSGTLNPALQDRHGRPKRDISTIIHILNDLLCATPQYRRHSATATYSVSTPGGGTNFTPVVRLGTTPMSSSSQTKGQQSRQAKDTAPASEEAVDACGFTSRVTCSDEEESSVDDDQVTRTKFERLRFKLEQRRARMKARRKARASPYAAPESEGLATTSWSSETTTLVASKSTPDASPGLDGASQGIEVEGGEDTADPAALCELNSGTVVA